MRVLIIAAAAFLAACGSTPQASNTGAQGNDTVMNANSNSAAINSLTQAEQAEGWTLLFDGQSKSGWHSYLNKTSLDSWKVEDGTLMLDPKGGGGGSIVTNDEYENYHFKIDWKISKNGNRRDYFQRQRVSRVRQ